ncbi:hypothetical protein T4D_10104 [Trichinella pseudospiralis]|uniref:Uncharacterized protein n=1 Tax=Trichinella pseudospiralis TaxID=6337 RepID=A0A0V1F751_TRIPS|nr:hypothetical protein T4D_10104 [Trichinella pseudospiralis]
MLSYGKCKSRRIGDNNKKKMNSSEEYGHAEGSCTGYFLNCSGGGLLSGMRESVYDSEIRRLICTPTIDSTYLFESTVATAFDGDIGVANTIRNSCRQITDTSTKLYYPEVESPQVASVPRFAMEFSAIFVIAWCTDKDSQNASTHLYNKNN